MDHTGLPYRRSQAEKDTALPAGCETTLLLSSDQLLMCLRDLRMARLELKQHCGEALKSHGQFSERCTLECSSDDDGIDDDNEVEDDEDMSSSTSSWGSAR